MCRLHIFNLLAIFSDSVEMSQLGNEKEQRLCLSVYIIYIYIYMVGLHSLLLHLLQGAALVTAQAKAWYLSLFDEEKTSSSTSFRNRSSIRWNGLQYQHVLALCALLTGVISKGLTLQTFVSDVCV